MNKISLIIISISLGCPVGMTGQLIVPAETRPMKVEAPANTGLDGGIYVLPATAGVRITYKSDAPVSWQRFSNLGAAYAEEIGDVSHDGREWGIVLDGGDIGIVATTGGVSHYYWFVDYASHRLELDGLGIASEQDCDRTSLVPYGSGDRIQYYTINGRSEVLSREIKIEYTSLVYNSDSGSYQPSPTTVSIPYLQETISVEAPLCDTEFHMSGDRFTSYWNEEQQVTSEQWHARAVSAETTAIQTERDVPNEQKDTEAQLGGSAPCEITFTAAVSDAAVFREWQISSDPEFGIVDYRYNELEIEHTFREQGTSYVRFIADNAEGSCEFVGPTYEIFIGESALRCPNAFTPFTSPGVNDEWRVSYKSLIDFECHIFNRWGTELFNTTDPSIGWDGKYGGKYVPAGTYYYVIRAEGSDGKKYKLSGDINIIGYHGGNNSVTEE
ncbi:MAG: gliding motility-associated C-terminal domain-containing protein [Muribaculaceae bacterium]|nr:gliding motility-associated C-terminal domain-containing protein [Muribaculaceae bacterium]